MINDELRRRWSAPLLREARPNVSVSMTYDETKFAHRCKCVVGGIGEYQYVTELFIDGNPNVTQHPEWLRYHSEKIVRLAETGVFFRWIEMTLPAEHRRAFNDMYQLVSQVQLLPSDPSITQIDDSWLAVLTTRSGQWRETIKEIKRDPMLLYAVLTMLKK